MPRGGNDTTLASSDEGSCGVPVMLSVDVGSLTAFDTKGDLNGISQGWKKWRGSFGLYLTGKGVTDDKQKFSAKVVSTHNKANVKLILWLSGVLDTLC